MIRLGGLAAFSLMALLVEVTPGPNMGYLAAIAARHGRKAGFVVVLGVAMGLTVDLAAVLAGLAAFVLSHRALYETMRWAGVGYMAWLAVDAWRSTSTRYPSEAASESLGRLFSRGLIANLLNAKAALFMITVLPTFLDPKLGYVTWQMLWLGLIYLVIASGVHTAIVLASSRAATFDLFRLTKTTSTRVYAVSLLLVALWLGYTTGAAA